MKMLKNKQPPKQIAVSVVIPKDLAEDCIRLADHPEEFKFAPFLRMLARDYVARQKRNPLKKGIR